MAKIAVIASWQPRPGRNPYDLGSNRASPLGLQWTDFRIFVAHLLNEKKNLDAVIAETESLLRTTFGYATLQNRSDHEKTNALLSATKQYARKLAEHPKTPSSRTPRDFRQRGLAEHYWVSTRSRKNSPPLIGSRPVSSVLPQVFLRSLVS